MIDWLIEKLPDFIGKGVFDYITFRALMAVLTSFLIGILSGSKLIKIIYQLNFRDKSRDYGDVSNRSKDGTPTMGGIIIFLSFFISVLVWGKLENYFLGILLFSAFWFTSLGFCDDYLKKMRGGSDQGMNRGLKFFFQILFGVILGLLVLSRQPAGYPPDIITKLFVPFVKAPLVDLKFFYYPFVVLVIICIANAINFADGLDGLATVPASMTIFVYAVFAYVLSNFKVAEYLMFPYIKGAEELVVALAALIGALGAFLWFNAYPAQIFMGDTGALFLGGVIATTAVLLKKELLFVIAGGVFVLEFISVFVQDYIGIKLLKRRIFYRAPIHHSYQFLGISEPKIVVRFWILAIIFTLISLISLKVR